MISALAGMFGRLSPSAATVPSAVAIIVEAIEMMNELAIEFIHSLEPNNASYQRSE